MKPRHARAVRPEQTDRPVPATSPLDPARTTLYSPGDLYDAPAYADTFDARAYAWTLHATSREDRLAAALHDHAIDEALDDWVAGRRLVGVMGGHDVRRGEPAYAEAVRLGALLGARLSVATGGGPGAMEAASLGARLARTADPSAAAAAAVARLAQAPSFRPSADAWLAPALALLDDVLDDVLDPAPAAHEPGVLAIPTWYYGHEPTHVFATAIAKYVRNALREAILLQVCTAGIVFLPGAAGTVQEVFQDACENYYATPEQVAPMVLVGRRWWTEHLPAWPLLRALAAGRDMADRVHLVDDLDEAAALLAG